MILAACVAGVALLAGAYLFFTHLESQEYAPQARAAYTGSHNATTVQAEDGNQYKTRSRIRTVLLMGVDRSGSAENSGNYRNNGQADFLRVLVVDDERKVVTHIPIDRDTITPITILGVLGNKSGMRSTQICLSYSFGDGGEKSCELVAEAVSNLLLGVTIDDYLAMNLDGIPVLNDWAGGVTVTLEDDFSHIDPEWVAGATVYLEGEKAETFVRSRMTVGDGSNEGRMRRQQAYITALTDQVIARLNENQDAAGVLFDALGDNLITNASRGRIVNECWAARQYTHEFVTIDGQYSIGTDGFKEFHADESSIEKIVLSVFYTEEN